MTLFGRNQFGFEATFNRIAPANFGEKVGIPLGWIVVHYGHIAAKADRRKAHGEWFEISSDRFTIYRMLRFSPNIVKGDGANPAGMVIDWIGWIDLHDREEEVDGPISLKLRRLPWWRRPKAYLNHPDPAIRFSGWLGWISLILGIVSLLLALPYDWIGQQIGVLRAFISALGCSG